MPSSTKQSAICAGTILLFEHNSDSHPREPRWLQEAVRLQVNLVSCTHISWAVCLTPQWRLWQLPPCVLAAASRTGSIPDLGWVPSKPSLKWSTSVAGTGQAWAWHAWDALHARDGSDLCFSLGANCSLGLRKGMHGHWRPLSLSLQSAFSFLPASSLLSSPGRGTTGFKFWKDRRDIPEARRPRNVRRVLPKAAALVPVSSFARFTRSLCLLPLAPFSMCRDRLLPPVFLILY